MDILHRLKNNVIISIQALPDEPLYEEKCMRALIESVISLGGINVVRLAGKRDIKNTKEKYPDVIVIGITKPDKIPKNYKEIVYITPTAEDCKNVIEAGADVVAFDGTLRNRPDNETVKDLIDFIHSKNKLAMADIATFDEAKNAYSLGADIVSTTLSGYTKETENNFDILDCPDFELVKKIKKNLDIFTVLEGRIWEKKDVITAFSSGADSVVIGSAVTRPQLIAKRFIDAANKIKKQGSM